MCAGTQKKVILYHGGDEEIKTEHIIFPGPRPDCDFGRGFYMTAVSAVAEEWVRNKSSPVISQYELKYYEHETTALYGLDWIKAVVGFRTSAYTVEFTRNIIIGAIANDRMNDALALFMSRGIAGISDRMLFDCLSLVQLGDQYVLTKNAAGLTFLKSYVLKGKMLQDAKHRHEERRRSMTKKLGDIRRRRYDDEKFVVDYMEEFRHGVTF